MKNPLLIPFKGALLSSVDLRFGLPLGGFIPLLAPYTPQICWGRWAAGVPYTLQTQLDIY